MVPPTALRLYPRRVTDLLTDPAHRVSPRAVSYWRISSAFGWLVFLGILVTVWRLWFDHLTWPAVGIGVWGLYAVAHVIAMPVVRYRVHRWEVTPTAVRTRSGWLSREQRIAPLSRIQTVDSSQGALMRVFGLTSVTVTTASAAGPVTIDALDTATAERLAAELTVATAATPGDAT